MNDRFYDEGVNIAREIDKLIDRRIKEIGPTTESELHSIVIGMFRELNLTKTRG
jgi:hypothetical protein